MKTIINLNTKKVLSILFFTFFIAANFNLTAQNPGNIGSTDLQLWMKANAGTNTTTDGADITSWSDNSPNSFTAVTGATNSPRYNKDVINFNPAISFNSSRGQKRYLKIPTASVSGTGLDITPSPAAPTVSKRSSMTIFAAFLTDGSGAGTMFSRATSNSRSYQLWLGDRDRVVHYTLGRTSGTGQSDPNSGINYGTIHARNDAKISSATIDINTDLSNDPNTSKILRYVNGYLDPLTVHTDGDAGFGTGETTNMDVLIGARRNSNNTNTGNELIGNVAELVVYDRVLNASERQKVETYLAIKYGITLGYNDEYYKWENNPNTTTDFGYLGTSNDYILSNNDLAWTGIDNAGFGYNVFGIARDDDSALLQLKSKSVHVEEMTGNTSVITMEDESRSITNDRDYLLVGNNGASVQLQSSSVPERVTSTINRIWKARESSNDVGTIKLEFDLSQFSISGADDLELVVSKNSNLTNYKNYLGTYNSISKVVTFTGVDLDDAEYFTLAKLEELESSYHLVFNGTSQLVDLDDNLDLGNAFTISTWINRESGSNNTSIFSKRNTNLSQGYDFKISSTGRLQMIWRTSTGTIQQIYSAVTIPLDEWHHVAIIYGNGIAKIFIDGVEAKSIALQAPASTTHSASIGAGNVNSPNRHFKGTIDELRVWDIALTENQMRYIMNQEIENNTGIVNGLILPSSITKNEISALPWSNLKAYYPFSHVRGNCLFNKSSNTLENGRLYNTPTSSIKTQTAPLPYYSVANGNWNTNSTWLNGSEQTIPGTTSVVNAHKTIDWNIVVTNHNITMDNSSLPNASNGNRSLSALFVDSNKITVNGNNSGTGYGITISHYLTLDGKIDLEGESQLIQSKDSDLDVTSSGTIEKDQQGTQDLFTYNYWSSPVGLSNTTSNNTSYRLSNNLFKDGTNSGSPSNINFVSGYDGALGTPISIASYWIWKFSNKTSNDYSSWQHVKHTETLLAGEGFTMKGVNNTSDNVSLTQNYVIEGKPNNGNITLPINAGNDYLVGNPYPSAIDAEKFILDNGPTIEGTGNTTGTLYFWEHWGGGSHILSEYQGGYATYNLAGGVASASIGTSNPDVATGGTPTKIPGKYIPVAQGFFVTGEATGTVKFNNSQRAFQKEGTSASVFVRNSTFSPTANADNGDDRTKIRLGFNSINNIHRQLLVTSDERATINYDWGFDGKNIDSQIDEMSWMIDDSKYVIQGINGINETTVLPIGIYTSTEGNNTITIDALVNFPEELQVYVHDIELNNYHNLRSSDYTINLLAGEHLNRFEITFTNQALSIDEIENTTNIELYFNNETESIIIDNPRQINIDNAEMINMIGQSVYKYNAIKLNNLIELKTKNISTGAYIIKLKTENGTISKKVLVN